MRCLLSRIVASPAATAAAAVALGTIPHLSRDYSTTPLLRQCAPVQDRASFSSHLHHARSSSDAHPSVAQYTHAFAEVEGRRPRILLCTFEDSSQGRPDDKFATVMADFGFDVDIGPARQSPEQIARQAIEADVHGIHVSVLTDAGAVPLPCLLECLRRSDAQDIFVTVAAASPLKEKITGVSCVKRGDFAGAAETIVQLLQASNDATQP